ncbi:MAG: universal stress protein [Syntrophobacterales bacterium]|nr:universal stress protein [Syntrophobacterales bacterium]
MNGRGILVAVDVSEWAYRVVEYAGIVLGAESDIPITILHVMSPLPESFWDVESSPLVTYRPEAMLAWDVAQRKAVEAEMEKLANILVGQGISRDRINIMVQQRQVGIARDIVFEAQKGYKALVVGRRGASRLKELIIGSIASKVLSRLTTVPLWVVGEKPQDKGIVIGLDPSEEAMKAVKYVASILGGKDRPDWTIHLIHVARALELLTVNYDPFFTPDERVEWMRRVEQQHMEEIRAKMGDVFEEARKILEEAGIRRKRIQEDIISGAYSRAATLIEEARKRNCGTIVVGRRGLSKIEEFFLGRVSSKTLQMASDKTVWIVG